MTNDVQLVFSAKIGDAISGIQQVKQAMQDLRAPIDQVAASVAMVTTAFRAMIGLAVVDFFVHAAEASLQTGMQMQALHFQLIAVTGSAYDAGQAEKFAADMAERYGLKIVETEAALAKFLAATRGTNLTLKEAEQAFEGVSVYAKAMQLDANHVSRAMIAFQEIMGMGNLKAQQMTMLIRDLHISYQMMAQGLGITTSKLREMMAEGLVPGKDAILGLSKTMQEQFGSVAKQASDTLEANLNRLSNSWVRAEQVFNTTGGMTAANDAVKLLRKVVDEMAPAMELFAVLAEGAVIDLAKLAEWAVIGADNVAKLVTTIQFGGEIMRGDKTGIAEYNRQIGNLNANIIKARKDYNDMVTDMQVAHALPGGPGKPNGEAGGGGEDTKSRVSKWDDELQHMLYSQHLFFDQAEEAEKTYWMHILSAQKLSAAERGEIEKKVHAMQQKDYGEDLSKQEEAYNQMQAAAGKDYTQWLRIQHDKEKMLAKAYGDRSKQAEKAMAEERQKTQQQLHQLTSDYQKTFMGMFQSFNQALRGMLQGTTSFKQAMGEMILNLGFKFLEVVEEMLAKWVATEIAKTVISHAQDAARTTGAVAAATTQGGILHGFSAAAVATDAAAAYAGVFANMAPYLGPLAAGPASAAYATVMSAEAAMPSFDHGAYELPGDMVAKVHKGETILNASEASDFRSVMKNMGGGQASYAPNIAFHISAVDGPGVARMLKKQKSVITSMIAGAGRNFSSRLPSIAAGGK